MAGDPVNIKLKPGATPFRMSVARQIPLRFEKPATEVIQGVATNQRVNALICLSQLNLSVKNK